MVLSDQTYNTQDKHKKPKQLNLTKQNKSMKLASILPILGFLRLSIYFLLQSLPPVHWNISNGRSKLNCTVVRLTVTDTWPPALKILPSEWLLVRYQP